MSKLSKLLGFEPNSEMKKKILDTSHREGITVMEAAAKFQLPDIFMVDDFGMIDTDQGLMTPGQFEKMNPYKKFVTLQRDK